MELSKQHVSCLVARLATKKLVQNWSKSHSRLKAEFNGTLVQQTLMHVTRFVGSIIGLNKPDVAF